jgi:plasmid stabilization system protein ParE
MRVRWTDNALRHLLDIYEYISQNSPLKVKVTDKLAVKRRKRLCRKSALR